jgi:Sec-independent protein translocase protein TatA
LPVVGVWEMVVILVAVLMFGPKRIPQIARQVGSMMAQLRRTSDEFMRELTREPVEDVDSSEPTEKAKDDAYGAEGYVEENYGTKEAQSLTSEQIREAASKLGIETEGRSDEEIRSEMMERIYASPIKEEDQSPPDS